MIISCQNCLIQRAEVLRTIQRPALTESARAALKALPQASAALADVSQLLAVSAIGPVIKGLIPIPMPFGCKESM